MSRLREHPLHSILGLVIWSLWFVALYAGQGLGCALAPPAPADGAATWLNAVLGVFTGLTVLLLLGLALFSWRSAAAGSPQRFVLRLAAGVHLVGAAATVFIGLTLLGLPPCA
ncbi:MULTISPECIES: hypothetical protein [Pseudomonas]|uniref:Uncharacterized protein n=1 Tax=Pseudomonas flexibilis TaxID=706570 RepID=A0A0B2D1F9_9PSED|nr:MULTISPECIES: hypothetical protein [Pseudomonas]KHL68329.1 hypothetical protein SF06_29820 [Pseudomonas flexibilis]KHO63796.1 hypothetical protein PT85_14955 [Pseudomonas flexibilis]SCY26022.1 hypothetical protein SAMN02927929_02073 [Pseudomonas flexibilis]SIQ31766.1 hypothetical protein SAMN05421672_10560 [Pseudomonas flexibilis]